ncbi:hypothetical protein ACGFSB_17640 [Streptomyces sp. NPDC048441]|uniref:hypothetical protein n=1 Tax=Streptomyces sp. NPDC048441 TaxID=3365552 RepID=UPI00371F7FCE
MIESPLPGEQAFAQDDEIAAWSKAAQVVGLGLQLAGQADALRSEDGATELQIPEIPPLSYPFLTEFAEFYIQDHLRIELPFHWHEFPGWSQPIASHIQDMVRPAPQRWWDEYGGLESALAPTLYEAVRQDKDPRAAAASLLHVSQFSRHQIVRVAAASSLAGLRTTLTWPTIETLAEGCSSANDTVQQIAIDALLHAAPSHPVLAELRESHKPDEGKGAERAHTSVIVPGTWSRFKRPSWWRPGERLFDYLQKEPGNSEPSDGTFPPVGNDLYAHDNYYRWPTGFTVHDRVAGAHALAKWAADRQCTGFSKVFAHSHGGNVALLAAASHKLRIDMLVMIATPPHQRNALEWQVISEHVKHIVSMRPRFDLTVLLDSLWSRVKKIPVTGEFPANRVRILPVPVWYGHSVLTRPEVWTRHRLAHELAAEYEADG